MPRAGLEPARRKPTRDFKSYRTYGYSSDLKSANIKDLPGGDESGTFKFLIGSNPVSPTILSPTFCEFFPSINLAVRPELSIIIISTRTYSAARIAR